MSYLLKNHRINNKEKFNSFQIIMTIVIQFQYQFDVI